MQDQVKSETASPRSGFAWGALAVMAALFIAFLFRALPLQLDPVRAANRPDQFDTTEAIAKLSRVLGDQKPHAVDSPNLDAVRERLLNEIRKLGYTPEVHDETACRGSKTGSNVRCGRVKNIVFSAGPVAGSALLLSAHYDSVEAGPGAADDGIGVAAWLEIADLLRKTPPNKPVLFLLTDGEEPGLLGAQAFDDRKAYGHEINRIINLEARGDRGPAMMFETSHPNGAIVADWAKGAPRPAANSMMTAVYELLPNSTDLTVHLGRGYKGVNIAVGDGYAFYHTEHDDIAHLDPRSVQHMGDQALGAARTFLASSNQASGEAVYSDIAEHIFLIMPQQIGLILLGLCFGVSALLNISPAHDISWKAFSWRAFLSPLAVMVGAGFLAFVGEWAVSLVRPEAEFWTAHPLALNSLFFIGSLIAAALTLSFVAGLERREALFAAGWFWVLTVGMGLSIGVPGISIIFLIPGLVFVLAAAVARFMPKLALAAHAVAGAALLLIFLPLIQLVDIMMGLGLAAVFGVLEAIVLAPFLSLIGTMPANPTKAATFAALAAAWLAAAAAAAVLPAYSAEAPLGLDLAANFDMDAKTAELAAVVAPGSVPSEMKKLLDQPPARVIPGMGAAMAHHKLAFTDRASAAASVESDTANGDKRIVVLRLSAPGAIQVRLLIPADASPSAALFEGAPNPVELRSSPTGIFSLSCVGLSCDGKRLTLTLPPKREGAAGDNWIIQGIWQGLPADAEPVRAARPSSALPIQTGDVTMTTHRFKP